MTSNETLLDSHGESSDNYWKSNPTVVFDVGLSTLDLAHEEIWILDSGCSKHITGNSNLFTNLEPQTTHAMVQTTRNQLLHVERKGNVRSDNWGGDYIRGAF